MKGEYMSNSSLQKLLISGNSALIKVILEEFPDLFDLTKNLGPTEEKRKSSCIDKVKNDLIAAKSAQIVYLSSRISTLTFRGISSNELQISSG